MKKSYRDIPWPREYKRLFVQGGNWKEIACFGWGDNWQRFYRYCRGYKESADQLIDDAIASKQNHRLNMVVFPAFHMYRHYIELSLKQAILKFGSGEYSERIEILKLKHDLVALWKEYIKIKFFTHGIERTTLEVVEKYIQEFSKLDKSSCSFRYPITLDSDLIFREQQRVNLRHVKDRMAELETFFSGTAAHMDEVLEYNAEMWAEFENDCDYY